MPPPEPLGTWGSPAEALKASDPLIQPKTPVGTLSTQALIPVNFTLLQINKETGAPSPALWAVDAGASRGQTQGTVPAHHGSPPGTVHITLLGVARSPSFQGHLPHSLPSSLASLVSQWGQTPGSCPPHGLTLPGDRGFSVAGTPSHSRFTAPSSLSICQPSTHPGSPLFP